MTQLLFFLLACTGTDDSSKDSGDSPEESQVDSENQDSDSGKDSEKESSGGDDSDDIHSDDSRPPDSGEDSGADSDSGPDSGDSSPPDSGGDSGDSNPDSGDSGGDSGDSGGGACTVADLLWTAEVRDATGAAGTVFSPRQPLTVAGVVSNPCSSDVSFTTPDSCLVTSYSVTDSRGQGMGVGIACAAVLTSWVVPAGGTVEESTNFGRLTPESYVLDVSFNYGNHTGSQAFVVQ